MLPNRKFRALESWDAEERILATYGLLAIPTTALAIGLGLLVWRDWLAALVTSVLGMG